MTKVKILNQNDVETIARRIARQTLEAELKRLRAEVESLRARLFESCRITDGGKKVEDGFLVDDIPLSVRIANCLNNANIRTVGQLRKMTEQNMLRWRNFGSGSLTELKAILSAYGVKIGESL